MGAQEATENISGGSQAAEETGTVQALEPAGEFSQKPEPLRSKAENDISELRAAKVA